MQTRLIRLAILSLVVLPSLVRTARAQTPAPINDCFTNALILKGYSPSTVNPVDGATLELGEPAHLDGAPCKSIWWRWQAPTHGTLVLSLQFSDATNITLAVYTGNALETLSRVARGGDWLMVPVRGGVTYFIAGVISPETPGQISLRLHLNVFGPPSIPVPGNLLQEWSFEGTGLNFNYWQGPPVGGAVHDPFGADGDTWAVVGGYNSLWQDFATVPGRNYEVRFAYRGPYILKWDNTEIFTIGVPDAEASYWHWTNFTATASNTTSRLTFYALGNSPLDAVSVVWMNEAPSIITQPVSASSFVGATASFLAGVQGSPPLAYQWFFNGMPLAGQTYNRLVLDHLVPSQAGSYSMTVTNAFGAATTDVATLVVEAPSSPIIVLQPYGDSVAEGGYFALSVAAAGPPNLGYQWHLEGSPISGATDRHLVFSPFSATNAGTYTVKVSTATEAVWSLPAVLSVASGPQGGGLVILANRFVEGPVPFDQPVFDADGATRLTGTNYAAQLYAGPSLALLRAAGDPTPFTAPGIFASRVVTLPTVAPGSNAVVQVRAWDRAQGASYEEARALGGKVGRSEVFQTVAGGDGFPTTYLNDLKSFSLQAGLPQFVIGHIELAGKQPDGTVLWSLRGNAGYRYLVERSITNFTWTPMVVVTNFTGTVSFRDPAPADYTLYRARILE